jgi:DNA polymerase-1
MRDAERPVLHLIDGSGYIFRAYYAVPPLSTRDGTPTNAVVGFAKMLNKLLKADRPGALGMAFDTGEDNFRHAIYPEYKANRDAPPEDLAPQFGLIHELVEAMDIPILQRVGFEADDILATLTHKAVAAGYDVVVVTGDKDLMQLVGPHVRLFDPLKDRTFRRDDVIERFFVPPEQIADILALAGDHSDNVPGVQGIGPKFAAKLVQRFGDVEAIIAGLAAQQPKNKSYEQAVVDQAERARLSKRLVLLREDVPITLDVEPLRYTAPDKAKLGPFLQRIEAWGLLRDFGIDPNPQAAADTAPQAKAAPARAQPVAAPLAPWEAPQPQRSQQAELFTSDHFAPKPLPELPPSTGDIDRARYRTVLTQEDLEAVVARAQTEKALSVDLETTSLNASAADIVGVALCVPGDTAVYVPVAHRYLGAPTQLPRQQVLDTLRPVLESDAIVKWGQNLKYDFVVFRRAGVHLTGIGHDAMLAAYALDPARSSYSLDALAREVLGHDTITYTEVTGRGAQKINFYEVPIERATTYAAEDADVALQVGQRLVADVHTAGLDGVYRDIEMPLLPVLATMEAHGVRIDMAQLGELAREFGQRLSDLEASAYLDIGRTINLGSPKQLSQLFFDELGLPPVKKTKTGYSTDQEVLESLARIHPLPRIILEHRLLSKLRSTYVDALPRMVNAETGRVHTSFNQTGTATGRLSSSDPNLQNIPIRGDDGRRIRAAFTAPEGHEIISADYSQVELRVMAHLSGDPSFVEAFNRNEDIHRRTAMEILTHGAEPSPEMRRRAKAINFGILYGQSEFGLSKLLNIPRAEAHAYIAAYFGRYSSIRAFMDETIAEGRKRGYVSTLMGRRRPVPNLASKNANLRQGAERIAMNTPVQGTAADLIKLAMLKVAGRLTRERLKARLVLQVHDELVLESPLQEREAVTALLQEEMSQVLQLRVPIVVDVGHGPNWAEAH